MLPDVIKVKSVRKAKQEKLDPKRDADKLCAVVAYHYKYTLAEARRLPHKDVQLLVRTIRREQASQYYTLTQIASAAHTKKLEGFKKLSEAFKNVMNE